MMKADPKPGDWVMVEFGSSINPGKEITGIVSRVTSDEVIINRRVYRHEEISKLEVLDEGSRAAASA